MMDILPALNISNVAMLRQSDDAIVGLGDRCVESASNAVVRNASARRELRELQSTSDGSPLSILKETTLHNNIINEVTVANSIVKKLLTIPELLNR